MAGLQRKAWNELSDAYRRRLERSGITEAEHRGGQTLHKARGHISREKESGDKRYRHDRSHFVAKLVNNYGKDEDDVLEVLAEHSREEIEELIENQRRAERAYDQGIRGEATGIWEARPRSFPDWMSPYHGVFS